MSTKNPRGRPRVDSDMLRARVERDVLEALDQFCAEEKPPASRPDGLRRILRDWLVARGYLRPGDDAEK